MGYFQYICNKCICTENKLKMLSDLCIIIYAGSVRPVLDVELFMCRT